MRACVTPPRRLGCSAVCVGSSHRTVSCVSASYCNRPALGVRQFQGVPSLRAGGWIYKVDSSSSFCARLRMTAPSQEMPDHLFLSGGLHV